MVSPVHHNISTLLTSPETYPIYEITSMYTLGGIYDNNIYHFVLIEYLDTRIVGGVEPGNGTCVRGFDNAGFITGTSSDIWNKDGGDLVWYLRQGAASATSPTEAEKYGFIIKEFLGATSSSNSTIKGPAGYDPNLFYQYNAATSPVAKDTGLVIEDGGETSQNVPLYPLIQKKRKVDVIFAVDSLGSNSFETDWPTGSASISTYKRRLINVANDTSFPPIPDLDTLPNLDYETPVPYTPTAYFAGSES
ncbi:hypothetical protein N7466_006491 [Penicillium verhagenii]|uniref:uncharacterized protein n=1 Tax=Penicillium verhagenii TaxID=1562060 RepID=UPI002544F3FF|nr:uncharacterized protein N7466_006491 [Penicillium verhagenii]KAJ5930998.1 hypothetical protein N7466_006491 [Penicillium verhagenii]